MPELILYLLKANAALILFYLAYRLLLRKLTFYTYNRVFLLAALLISLAFPLLDLTVLYAQPSQLGSEFILLLPEWSEEVITEQGQEHGFWQWLVLLYISGVTLMAARFILQALSLWHVHRRSALKVWQGQAYQELQEEVSPFSFWRNIYLNPKQHTEQELKSLLLHERVHVQQLHTLDVVLGQLACIVYWFNPTAWLLLNGIRQNLEYIADQQVLQQGIDSRSYQYSLLHVGQQQLKESSLTMSFNFNHIKDRIMMMNKQRTSPLHKLKYLLLPPAVLVLALLATTSKAEVEQLSQSITEQPQSDNSASAAITISGSAQDSIVYFVNGKRTPEASIKSMDPKQIASVEVLKGEKAQELVSDKDVKGVVKITTKKETSPGTSQKDSKVEGAVVSVSGGGMSKSLTELPQDAIYIIDDKEASLQEVKQLSPDKIKAVSVIKNSDKMVQKYGPKANKGVIMIYTKE